MIIYGSKAAAIATESIYDKCSSCGKQNTIEMTVFQKYAHLFWIPVFPIGRTGVTRCSHCKQVLDKNEFPNNLTAAYESIRSYGKTPVWTFAGLMLLAVLTVLGVISSKQSDAKNLKLILAPQKGDIYEIKKGYKEYTLSKVDHVAGDTVFMMANQYITNKFSGLSELKSKGDESYAWQLAPILKTELKRMLDKGEIMDVERK